MSSAFRFIRKQLAPRWLTEGDGEQIGYSLDIIKDAFAERCRLGLLARFPQNGPNGETAPPDALSAIGRDRRLVRGISETDAQYAARLLAWLDDRTKAGNPWMLMKQLAGYLGPLPSFRTVDQRGNWFSRAVDGTESVTLNTGNWDWDGSAATFWSRFWVIIYPRGLWTEGAYDWGDGGAMPDWGEASATTWGSTATAEQVRSVRSIVADWKPYGTRCVNIIVAFDTASFDPTAPEPDGLWGKNSKTVAGVAVPARLSTARYWDGV